jgi:hypothetical protein
MCDRPIVRDGVLPEFATGTEGPGHRKLGVVGPGPLHSQEARRSATTKTTARMR